MTKKLAIAVAMISVGSTTVAHAKTSKTRSEFAQKYAATFGQQPSKKTWNLGCKPTCSGDCGNSGKCGSSNGGNGNR